MFLRFLTLYLLIASSAFADVKAVIDAPSEAKPGDLVVLNGTQSVGDGFRWVTPPGLQTLTCSELEMAFASGTPGRYTFMLIAADTEAAIDAECDQQQCPTVQEAVRRMSAAIESTLFARTGPSLRKNWLDVWRRPVNVELGKLTVNVKGYVTAMRAVATGLEEA